MYRHHDQRRGFKKGIDRDESRRRREETSVSLRYIQMIFLIPRRKKEREEAINRRRKIAHGVGDNDAIAEYDAQEFVAPDTNESVMTGADLIEKENMLNSIPDLANILTQSTVIETQFEALVQIRKMLSWVKNPPIQKVIDIGLVKFLHYSQYPKIQFEAEWALTNIASGDSEQTKSVIAAGAIPVLISLLQGSEIEVQEQAVWTIGNIVGDSPSTRDIVLEYDATKYLLPLLTINTKLSLLQNAIWVASNFCRGRPQPDFEKLKIFLNPIFNLLSCKDEKVLADACWALSYLSDDHGPDNARIQEVIESGVVPKVVPLMMHKSNTIKTPALRCIGNIVTGNDFQTQVVIDCGALTPLAMILANPKKGLRKEACWTISNITAGNQYQIEAVKRSNVIPLLIVLLRSPEFDIRFVDISFVNSIRKEAAWAICGGNEDQIKYLVEQGAIAPLCDILALSDSRIVSVALEGIENILQVGRLVAQGKNTENAYANDVEKCGGSQKIAALLRYNNQQIYLKALSILTDFFEEDTEPETGNDGVPEQLSFPTTNHFPQEGYNFPTQLNHPPQPSPFPTSLPFQPSGQTAQPSSNAFPMHAPGINPQFSNPWPANFGSR